MVLIHEVSVSMQRTINLGNYESLKIQVGASASVPDDGNPEQAARDLGKWCRERGSEIATSYFATKGASNAR